MEPPGGVCPVAAALRTPRRGARMHPDPPSLPALSAFLLEDNAQTRAHLGEVLRELCGAGVVATAATPAEGAAWLAAHPHDWDLLVTDLVLAEGHGLQLLEQRPARTQAQKIVVFSNYADAGVRKRCAQLGVDAVFDKSTELHALVAYCARLQERLQAKWPPPAPGPDPGQSREPTR